MALKTLVIFGPDHYLVRTRATVLLGISAAISGRKVLVTETEYTNYGFSMMLPRRLLPKGPDLFSIANFKNDSLLVLLQSNDKSQQKEQLAKASEDRDLIIHSCIDKANLSGNNVSKIVVAGLDGMLLSEGAKFAKQHKDAKLLIANNGQGPAYSYILEKASKQIPELANDHTEIALFEFNSISAPSREQLKLPLWQAVGKVVSEVLDITPNQISENFDPASTEAPVIQPIATTSSAATKPQQLQTKVIEPEPEQKPETKPESISESDQQQTSPKPKDSKSETVTSDDKRQEEKSQVSEPKSTEKEQQASEPKANLNPEKEQDTKQDAPVESSKSNNKDSSQNANKPPQYQKTRGATMSADIVLFKPIGIIDFAKAKESFAGCDHKTVVEPLCKKYNISLPDFNSGTSALISKLVGIVKKIPSGNSGKGRFECVSLGAIMLAEQAHERGELRLERTLREFAVEQFSREISDKLNLFPWVINSLWLSEVLISQDLADTVEDNLHKLVTHISEQLPNSVHNEQEQHGMIAMFSCVLARAHAEIPDNTITAERMHDFAKAKYETATDKFQQLINFARVVKAGSSEKFNPQISDGVAKAKDAFGDLVED